MNTVLVIIGWVLATFGSCWIIYVAWQRSVVWGAVCFLIPICQLFYVGLHWKEAKHPFFIQLAGSAVLILADVVGK